MNTNPSAHISPVRVVPLGEAAVGTALWSSRDQLEVTVVVKATFTLAHGSTVTPAATPSVVPDDEHHAGHPGRSLRAAGELAPRLPRVDVVLTGHAHTPGGQAASSVIVRLTVQRDRDVLINKAVRVQGDWSEERADFSLFQHMPLVWERALGGPESQENPAGVGLAGGRSPNLVDPRGRPIPACFAPIPRVWPVRARLLGDLDPGALEAAIPAIPEGFDWAHFQAAPADQRLDELRGDEVLVLDNLHVTLPRVETRLPSARGAARVYGPGPELEGGKPIELRADTLHVDTTAQTCTILWRGHFPTQGVDLRDLCVVGGVELPHRALAWPRERPPRPVEADAPPSAPASEPARESAPEQAPLARVSPARVQSTIRLDAAEVARQIAALGMRSETAAKAPEIREKAPAPAIREKPAASWRDESMTLDLTAEAARSAAAPLPFASDAGRPRSETAPRTTLELKAADVAKLTPADALPFVPGVPSYDGGRPPIPPGPAGQMPPAQPRDEAPRQQAPASSARPTLELKAEDVARISPADALPFVSEPARRLGERPAGGTMEFRAEDIARISPAHALPFGRDPTQRHSEPPPPVAAPPMVAPPPMMGAARSEPPPMMSVPVASPPLVSPPPMMAAPVASPPMVSPPPMMGAAHSEPPPVMDAPVASPPLVAPPPMMGVLRSETDSASEPAAPPPTGLRAEVLQRIAAREPLVDLELAGADLHELDLSGAVLSRLNLAGANLSRCKLAGARLVGAHLADADLMGADLRGADLGNADLARAVLTDARLDEAVLTDATLTGARGPGASFVGATATRTSFARGHWEEANFSRAAAAAADFSAAVLQGARFEGADLAAANFDDARASNALLDEARLAHAHLTGAHFESASLRDADAPGSIWEKATLDQASFAGANLKGANLRRATCLRTSFHGASLGGADLQRITGDGADLHEARLEGADLRQARLHEANFDRAVLRDVSAAKAELPRCRFDRADLTNASLRGAKLPGASFAHADLSGADLMDADVAGANVFGASRKTAKLGANARGLIEVDLDKTE